MRMCFRCWMAVAAVIVLSAAQVPAALAEAESFPECPEGFFSVDRARRRVQAGARRVRACPGVAIDPRCAR